MQRFTVACLVSAVTLLASQDAPAPDPQLLPRIRYHMGQMLTHLPNYTCLQTIERSERRYPKKKPSLNDVVRIEVALVNGKELFSWPGTGKFVDTEIGDMVKGGAIGTGTFGLHAKAVFMGGVATYKYEGTEELRGKKVHKWSFAVPQARSGYHLRDGINEAVVAYTGAFWIEAGTLDAMRLEVRAENVPASLRLASTSDAVEYQRVRIGDADFLLPASAELHMLDRSGNENINRTTFSQCRQYSGESRLLLDEEVAEEKAAKPPERVMTAPGGLYLDIGLESEIVIKSAAVGDPITAVLQKAAKVGTGVVIPKGALLHGRITHVRRGNLGRIPAVAVGIRFTEMEAPGWRVQLSGRLFSLATASQEFLNSRVAGPTNDSESETIAGSLIFVKEGTMQIRRGLRMTWLTRPTRNEDQQ